MEKLRYWNEKTDFNNIHNDSIFKFVDDFLEALNKSVGSNEADTLIQELIVIFLSGISNLAPIYKNIAFIEENEWRMYINLLYPSGTNPNENLVREFNKTIRRPFSELKSCVQNKKIVFYTEFDWTDHDDLIKEVYIGPKCEADEDDIRKIFAVFNMRSSEKIKITKSECSYR